MNRNIPISVYHNNIVDALKIRPPPFARWTNVEVAWCCQSGFVAQCIPPDYTGSSRSGRY